MNKQSHLKIYGILGWPARHSLSPLMHNAAFKQLKINAEYRIFEKSQQELAGFMQALAKNSICGLNVTVPYKEKVIPFLDKISQEARLIGAVNTIKVSKNKLEGFNTDAGGFLKHLTAGLKFNPQGKIIAIIGAGGAAKAVSVSLSQSRPKAMAVYDLDKIKLSGLIKHLRKNFPKVTFIPAPSIDRLNIKEAGLLINATPVGMKEEDACLVDKGLIHRRLLVYDLVYNPPQTKLLQLAKTQGAKVSNGLGMLLYQGALSFKIWTAKEPPIKIMEGALREGARNV